MKKIILMSTILSSTLLFATPKTYVNMNHSWLNHSDNGTVSDFNPTGFKWTAGHIVKEFDFMRFGLEATAMLGLNNETKTTVSSSTTGTFSNATEIIDKLYNVNLKAMIPIKDKFSVNAYLGASRVKIHSTATNYGDNNGWDNGISYGAGLQYNILSDVSVHVDYMQYFKNLNAVELGLGFRF